MCAALKLHTHSSSNSLCSAYSSWQADHVAGFAFGAGVKHGITGLSSPWWWPTIVILSGLVALNAMNKPNHACVCVFLYRIGDDIGTPITNITVLDAPRVYVPLLGDNKGLLPIKVRLSWGDDLPGSGEVQVRPPCQAGRVTMSKFPDEAR